MSNFRKYSAIATLVTGLAAASPASAQGYGSWGGFGAAGWGAGSSFVPVALGGSWGFAIIPGAYGYGSYGGYAAYGGYGGYGYGGGFYGAAYGGYGYSCRSRHHHRRAVYGGYTTAYRLMHVPSLKLACAD